MCELVLRMYVHQQERLQSQILNENDKAKLKKLETEASSNRTDLLLAEHAVWETESNIPQVFRNTYL